jgi:hypothetical protein
MAGPRVNARWFSPTTGTYVTISGSPFWTDGSHDFTPSGKGDWVLVLESAS